MPSISSALMAAGLIGASLLGRPVKVCREDGLSAPAPSWVEDGAIHLHIPRTKARLTEHEFDAIKGLVFHELAHLLYPPVNLGISEEYRKAHNILEDGRIESLLLSRYPAASEWLSKSYNKYIKHGAASKSLEYVLACGRWYLPDSTINAARDRSTIPFKDLDNLFYEYMEHPDNRAEVVIKLDRLLAQHPVKDLAHRPGNIQTTYSSGSKIDKQGDVSIIASNTEHQELVGVSPVRASGTSIEKEILAKLAVKLKTQAESSVESMARARPSTHGKLSPKLLSTRELSRFVFKSRGVSHKTRSVSLFLIVDTSWSMRYLNHAEYYKQVWTIGKARSMSGIKGKTIAFNNFAKVLEQVGATSDSPQSLPFYERSKLTSSLPILARELRSPNSLQVVIVLSDGDWNASEVEELSAISLQKNSAWGLILVDRDKPKLDYFDKVCANVKTENLSYAAIELAVSLIKEKCA